MATHWGYYWKVKKKHIPRTLCSKLNSIDSFKFYKNNTMRGFTISPIDVRADAYPHYLKITYRNRKKSSYKIAIERQASTYGGFRCFFKCPLCKKRMRLLYLAENSIFLCRGCLNLSYKSQRLRPTERYYHMAKKVKDLIGEKGGSLENYQKPPRMHTKTFKTLRLKKLYYEDKSHQASNQELRLWFGERAEPYLDSFFDYVDESKPWIKKKV
jgi:hypothetical protein